jgi:hypothetical protein
LTTFARRIGFVASNPAIGDRASMTVSAGNS